MKERGVASVTTVKVLTEADEKLTDALDAVQVITETGLVAPAAVQLGSLLQRRAGPALSLSSSQICTRTVPDDGVETCRESAPSKAARLALATAVVHAKLGPQADLKPRPLLKLAIGGDPRQPVDTKDPKRVLDVNDHIINFLNDNTIVEDVVVGQKEELPELKYDAKGVAIPVPKGKVKKVPITEKRTRSLYAADVIASQALQQKFNACMKEKGQAVQIDCGEKIVH